MVGPTVLTRRNLLGIERPAPRPCFAGLTLCRHHRHGQARISSKAGRIFHGVNEMMRIGEVFKRKPPAIQRSMAYHR